LEEDVAVIIEEEQEVMQYRDDVGNAEQLLRDQTIQTEAAEAVMQVFTMAPRIFISLNSSSDLRTMIFCIVKHWSNCRGLRSRTCELSFVPQGDDTKRCRSCDSAKKNMKCDRHPALFFSADPLLRLRG